MYQDRSTRLLLLGAFQVILGCLSGLMAVITVAAVLLAPMAKVPQGQALSFRVLLPALFLYAGLAVGLIWLGIGLARARRWAWTLTVVLSWMWLVVGVLGFLFFLFAVAPGMWSTMARQAAMPREVITAMVVVVAVFAGFVYIVVPAIIVGFCHHDSVRATCLKRDPKVRWTDRCPMPVLALSVIMALSIVSFASSMTYGNMVPMFGVFVTGPAGMALVVLMALVFAYLAWGTYRLQPAAWWGTVLLCLVATVSGAITYARADLMEAYERLGLPPEQLDVIRKSGIVQSMSQSGPWVAVLAGAACLGYLVYVRRYFTGEGVGKTEMPHAAGDLVSEL
jgi:hypothetical protein